ncbi:MAG: hypothetical protein JO301_11715 [Chitinophagaceae bacterium]|nr:hypothetical protein [Chitinophagaceae bacterium]
MDSAQRKKSKLLVFTLATTVIVLALLSIFFLFPDVNVGHPLRQTGNLSQLRDDFKLVLESYTNTIQLVITAFGAVAFLVTYQQKQGTQLSIKAWSLLSSGIVALIGALILCFFGKELLLKMIDNNVIRFDMGALKYTRWVSYICIILGSVFIGFFATEIAIISKRSNPDTDEKSIES